MNNLHSFTGTTLPAQPKKLSRAQVDIILAILGFEEEDHDDFVPRHTQMHIVVTRKRLLHSLRRQPAEAPKPVPSAPPVIPDPRVLDEKFRSNYRLN